MSETRCKCGEFRFDEPGAIDVHGSDCSYHSRIEPCRPACTSAREITDKERLDWLEKHRNISWCWDDIAGENPKVLWHVYDSGLDADFATAREAIDAAIRGEGR